MKNMKENVKKEHYRITLYYGSLFLVVGIIGKFFPQNLEVLISFCFIFGGASVLTGLFYFVTHRTESQSKENEKQNK